MSGPYERTAATRADAAELAPQLRPDDRAELIASWGDDVAAAIAYSIDVSFEAWTGRIDGRIAACWGLHLPNMLGGVAQPWLLTAGLVERFPLRFSKECRADLARWRALGFAIEGLVDGRYSRCHAWLESLGFSLDRTPATTGTTVPFYRYRLEA